MKKIPSKQLERFSNIFTQLGFVLVLFIVYVSLEHKTVQKKVAVFDTKEANFFALEPEQNIFIKRVVKAIPKVKKSVIKPIFFDKVEKGNNDIFETFIDNTPTENMVLIDIDDIIEINIKEKIQEDVDFINIQNAPVFKGCEGLSQEKNKVCFDQKMKQFVHHNFDVELANEIGLYSGKHKIYTQFVIDDEGDIIDVKIRTVYKQLEKEALRIIKKLPKFEPGKQNNRTVKVRYNLPIAFSVE